MELSSTPIHKSKPCIFLISLLFCIVVVGYYDQPNGYLVFQGYGYLNPSDDPDDLDSRIRGIKYSNQCIYDVVFCDVNDGVSYRVLSEKPFTVTSFVFLTYAYRAPPQKS
jgi:hypothetical protein